MVPPTDRMKDSSLPKELKQNMNTDARVSAFHFVRGHLSVSVLVLASGFLDSLSHMVPSRRTVQVSEQNLFLSCSSELGSLRRRISAKETLGQVQGYNDHSEHCGHKINRGRMLHHASLCIHISF